MCQPPLEDYAALGGHVDYIRPVEEILGERANRLGDGPRS
jgi:hypothetical protein